MENLIKTLEEKTGIPWVAVENSSNIVAFAYNKNGKILWIAFKMNKAAHQYVYAYQGINEGMFEDFQNAESKGKWVNTHLVSTGCKYCKYELITKKFYE